MGSTLPIVLAEDEADMAPFIWQLHRQIGDVFDIRVARFDCQRYGAVCTVALLYQPGEKTPRLAYFPAYVLTWSKGLRNGPEASMDLERLLASPDSPVPVRDYLREQLKSHSFFANTGLGLSDLPLHRT